VSDPHVRLVVTNHSAAAISLVLEPAGEIYSLASEQFRSVRDVGDLAPRLAIDIGDAETKIWAEGDGVLEIEP
jgi:hypothetical protein